jgi:hypothetical protein
MQEPGVQGKGERKGNVDIRLKILAPDAALHGRTSVNNRVETKIFVFAVSRNFRENFFSLFAKIFLRKCTKIAKM